MHGPIRSIFASMLCTADVNVILNDARIIGSRECVGEYKPYPPDKYHWYSSNQFNVVSNNFKSVQEMQRTINACLYIPCVEEHKRLRTSVRLLGIFIIVGESVLTKCSDITTGGRGNKVR